MIRFGRLFALIGVATLSTQAMAVDLNRPPSPRRLLTICMNKQMSASRTMSYNQAPAVCKAQLKAKGPDLASSTPPRPSSGMGK
jgi:hypothetical protein